MTDVAVWRDIFHLARDGSRKERDGAAHAIGTLLLKAHRSDELRSVLLELQEELDELMTDPRSAGFVLGQLKTKHGHAHRGMARQNYRKVYTVFNRYSADELAEWLNAHYEVPVAQKIMPSHNGVKRLAKWLKHRIRCQPGRRTHEHEIEKQVERFLPELVA